MSKLRIAILIVLVVAMLPISASTSARDTVTVSISTWAGAGESAELQEVIDEINAWSYGVHIHKDVFFLKTRA